MRYDGSVPGADPNGAYMVIEWGEYASDAPDFSRFISEEAARAYAGKRDTITKIIQEATQ